MDQLNTEYGRFLITFESICQDLRKTINSMCRTGGVTSEEYKYIEILLHGLTARPLIDKYRTIFITKFPKTDPCIHYINTLYKLFISLIEIRNSLAHGATSLGDPHANHNNFTLQYPKLNKSGYYSNIAIVEIKSLNELNNQVVKLEVCFRLVEVIVSLRKSNKEDFQSITTLKNELNGINMTLKISSKSLQI